MNADSDDKEDAIASGVNLDDWIILMPTSTTVEQCCAVKPRQVSQIYFTLLALSQVSVGDWFTQISYARRNRALGFFMPVGLPGVKIAA